MRFFFNVAGAVHDPDDEGIELPTISDARIEAVRFAGELLRERPQVVWQGDELRVEITDENQMMLCTFVAVGVDAPAAKGMT
jgi:phage terminase large subunit-like protein